MSNGLKALQIVLADPTRRCALLANEALCENILANPDLAPTLEAAILEDDHGIDALDILAALSAIIPAESFPEKMKRAKAAKAAKRETSGWAPPAKPAKPAKAPAKVYTSRVSFFESHSAGKIKAGRQEGNFSANTIGIEQLEGDRIVKRMMIGNLEAALIFSLPPDELAKLAPRTK